MTEKNSQLDKNYQDLFLNSPLGPKVLGDMIDTAELLDHPENEIQANLQSSVKMILARCGIGLGLSGEQYVRALMKGKIAVEGEDE